MPAIALEMFGDEQGHTAYAPKFTTVNKSVTLTENIMQGFTVPADFDNWIAVFSYQPGSNVFVACNFTAEVAGETFADTNSQFIPACRSVKAGDVINLITPDSSVIVGVSLYGRQ